MSLLAEVYGQLAADPQHRQPLHEAAQQYRAAMEGARLTREGIPVAIEALQGIDRYFAGELERLAGEVAAIEAALRERAQ